MTDAPKPKKAEAPNPFLERGLAVSPEDYALLRLGMMAVASEAERHADATSDPDERRRSIDVRARSIDLLERLGQYQLAGNGPAFEEIMKKFDARCKHAYEQKSEELLAKAIRDTLATMVRLHPDPAYAVANTVFDLSGKLASASEMQNVGPGVYRPLRDRIAEERDLYRQKNWWPETADYIDYLVSLLDDWIIKLSQGKKPWEELPT